MAPQSRSICRTAAAGLTSVLLFLAACDKTPAEKAAQVALTAESGRMTCKSQPIRRAGAGPAKKTGRSRRRSGVSLSRIGSSM